MNTEQKQQLKQMLDREKIKAEQRIAELKELTRPVEPDCAIGRVSRMDAINNRSVNQAALRTAEEKLKKISYAIVHVDEPDFGNCSKCGHPIQMGRLIVMPGSVHCIRCS
ncbi:MAG: TraR/DksA C4-type zinc finger protein [Bacteroidales bacterium]|nr:TraR/DksA C4-type zinc finger protein [Bacteroidales bacterium]